MQCSLHMAGVLKALSPLPALNFKNVIYGSWFFWGGGDSAFYGQRSVMTAWTNLVPGLFYRPPYSNPTGRKICVDTDCPLVFLALHVTCNIALHVTLHYMLHYITCYISLYVTLHYMLHCITFYIALHYIFISIFLFTWWTKK